MGSKTRADVTRLFPTESPGAVLNYRGWDLAGADLSGLPLSGVDLTGADLSPATSPTRSHCSASRGG